MNEEYIKILRAIHFEIVTRDCYKMDLWPNNFFDYIVDIGANAGVFTMYAHMRHPQAKIFAYEPGREAYEELTRNIFYMDNIKCYNEAFGNGTELVFCDGGNPGDSQFFLKGEVDRETTYSANSLSLAQILDRDEIDVSKKCFLKMDCEGGERFLLQDEKCVEIIKSLSGFSVEIHFPPRGFNRRTSERFKTLPPFEIWKKWIEDYFSESHSILYHYNSKWRGTGVYVLTNITS